MNDGHRRKWLQEILVTKTWLQKLVANGSCHEEGWLQIQVVTKRMVTKMWLQNCWSQMGVVTKKLVMNTTVKNPDENNWGIPCYTKWTEEIYSWDNSLRLW